MEREFDTVAKVDLVDQNKSIEAATIFTTPNNTDGDYIFTYDAKVIKGDSDSFISIRVRHTSPYGGIITTPALEVKNYTSGQSFSGSIFIQCMGGTQIQYMVDLNSKNSATYSLHLKLDRV